MKEMQKMVLIIDTETTGLEGYPKDRVLEIGIAELTDGEVREVYSEIVWYGDIVDFDSKYVNPNGSRGIWIYRNSDLRMEDTLNAEKDLNTVVKEVREIVSGKEVTSYNVKFDFDRFLDKDPWCLNDCCRREIDIMELATEKVYELVDSDSIEDAKQSLGELTDECSACADYWDMMDIDPVHLIDTLIEYAEAV